MLLLIFPNLSPILIVSFISILCSIKAQGLQGESNVDPDFNALACFVFV
jgi:hypothetical protein